jgi:organic hydroperoxide reductase OsmC/OhrA
MENHAYIVKIEWTGQRGVGTTAYDAYDRSFNLQAGEKPVLECSSDTIFRGDELKYNPEDMLVASLASCHMLWYLHFCADNHITVLEYSDAAEGVLSLEKGKPSKFTSITLKPTVRIKEADKVELAAQLHHKAHEFCFIANSVNFPVKVEGTIIF